MDYCDKGNLESYMHTQMSIPLSEAKIWKFTLQILIGLAYLHEKNIIHRDIKAKISSSQGITLQKWGFWR